MGAPGKTADRWAWTIQPEMTAIFMGAGYGAGAYFFTRGAFGPRWHPAAAGVLASAIFAALILIPTLVHYPCRRARVHDGRRRDGWVVVQLA